MPRLKVVEPAQATGKTRELYDGLQKKMGKVVNIFQGMGNSPAALNAYLSMSSAVMPRVSQTSPIAEVPPRRDWRVPR